VEGLDPLGRTGADEESRLREARLLSGSRRGFLTAENPLGKLDVGELEGAEPVAEGLGGRSSSVHRRGMRRMRATAAR